ncbi:MAG: MerR family transcriptional regulator [Bacteroidetes bacterium]|nr:MerR family transcriptional regulator [Bacteroidota bacterium]MBK9402348.1 MerR family transcriptional regulator [Bacteroidota bacterium]
MAPIIDFDKEPERLYYPIGDVAELFQVNASLIRFWEKEFDILKPKKNKKGNRLFTAEDVANLRVIFHLVKEKGYTLEGAKKMLEQKGDILARDVEIKETLLRTRKFLEELKAQL